MIESAPVGKASFTTPAEVKADASSEQLRFNGRRLTPLTNILMRLLVALMALVITTVVVYVERGCYRDNSQIGGLTWIDALYYATVSLSTTGYGDITPICESSRLVNVLIITPLRFVFLIVLVGTTVEVLTRRTREEWRSSRWRKKVKGHTVIIGFGVKGRAAAQAFLEAGVLPSSIVAISQDRIAIAEATREGFVGLIGDGRREVVLKEAMISRAAQIVVAADEDDTSVLVTLTARRLAPQARIVAAVRESQNVDLMRQSGADAVIPTSESAGHLMALSMMSPVAGEVMEDLLDSTRGLDVTERAVLPSEFGVKATEIDSSGQLVLAVIRGDVTHRFDGLEGLILTSGDRLVVIRRTPGSTFR